MHWTFLRTTIRKNNIYLHGKIHILAAVNHIFSHSFSPLLFSSAGFFFCVWFCMWTCFPQNSVSCCVCLLWLHVFRHQKLSKPEYLARSRITFRFSPTKSGWVRIFRERNAFKCDKFIVVNALQNCNVSNDSQAKCFDRQVVCFFNTSKYLRFCESFIFLFFIWYFFNLNH